MTICYIVEGNDYCLIRRSVKYMNQCGIAVIFVMKTKAAFEQCKADGFSCYYVGDVYNPHNSIPADELWDLDLKYGPPSIKEICNADYHFDFLSKRKSCQEQIVGRTYKFWEKFFLDHKVEYILSPNAHFFITRTVCNVARTYGKLPVGRMGGGPSPDRFIIFDVGESYFWSELREILERGFKPLNSREKETVYGFIEKSLQGLSEQNAYIMREAHNLSSLWHARNFVWFIREAITARIKGDQMGYSIAMQGSFSRLKRLWYRHVINYFFSYAKVDNEPYVYLPLPDKSEVANLATAHYWTKNFPSLIEEIAASLPMGISLYVKEHPHLLGNVSFSLLKRMNYIEGVKIVNPLLNGQSLIQHNNCKAVVVVNGTSGWEAFLMQKPVVMLGSASYLLHSRLIYKVQGIDELSDKLFSAIREGSNVYRLNEGEWLWFIHSVISTCGSGVTCAVPFTLGVNNESEIEINAKKVAQYIAHKLL